MESRHFCLIISLVLIVSGSYTALFDSKNDAMVLFALSSVTATASMIWSTPRKEDDEDEEKRHSD